jgi:hypothetical protein
MERRLWPAVKGREAKLGTALVNERFRGPVGAMTATGADIVERLRNLPYRPMVNYGNGDVRDELDPAIAEAAAEIERLRAALQRIVDEADSDDGLTAWDGSDIARAALEAIPGRKTG